MRSRNMAVAVPVALLLVATMAVPAAAQELPPGGTFVDDNGSVHEADIEAIHAEGITKGCNPPLNDRFCPTDSVTRGQMAAFLVRTLGLGPVPDDFDPFTDDDGSIFEDEIERLAQADITRGCTPTRFCPDEAVSREQMAAFLVRAYQYPAPGGSPDSFTDDDGSIFEHDIERLAAADVTRGCTASQFCPKDAVSRQQMATFLVRAEGLSPIVPPPAVEIGLEEVADGLSSPVYVTAPSGDDRLFIVEKTGRIRILDGGTVLSTPFLDLSSGHGLLSDGERGLLSMAFHPDYDSNGRFFVYYSRSGGPQDHQSVIAEYTVSGDPDVADPSADELLVINQPASNHNGGHLLFGPDGHLYVSLGDGGGSADQFDNAQDPSTLPGSILRLDVSTPGTYTSPPDNPFVDGGGADEVWAYGLRNPWRIWFDDGQLYVADVGESAVEEVSVVDDSDAGVNFGWSRLEGTRCFPSGSSCSTAGTVLPVAEHLHSNGACSITGGVVYRGSEIPQLVGRYLYSDLCDGVVRYLAMDGTTRVGAGDLTDEIGEVSGVWSFGVDGAGEVYLVRGSGSVHRLTGS